MILLRPTIYKETVVKPTILVNNEMSSVSRFSIQNAERMDLDHVITWYIYPIITGFGCLGNLLAFTVLLRRKLRRRTTCLYMSAMAIADVIMLTTKFILFLTFYVVTEITSVWLCKSGELCHGKPCVKA